MILGISRVQYLTVLVKSLINNLIVALKNQTDLIVQMDNLACPALLFLLLQHLCYPHTSRNQLNPSTESVNTRHLVHTVEQIFPLAVDHCSRAAML